MKRDNSCPQRSGRWIVLVLVFLLALVPRVVRPISRPMQWHSRAVRFVDAVLARDWEGTYQRYHPGVTTMWLSGVGLKVFGWREGLTSEQLIGAEPMKPGVMSEAITAGVIPLALTIAVCIVVSHLLISRVAGAKVALAASCLLALDPFHIAYSKVLHVDALLSTFMMTSALFMFSYLHRPSGRDSILSGMFAGLAFLTKSPSFFLIPYMPLAIGVHGLVVGVTSGRRAWGRWLRRSIRTLLLWGLVACITFVGLWPAMWVEPLHVLRQMGDRILFHIETAHHSPVFFNGQTTYEDPGPMFYVATVAWKTTAVTLLVLLVTVVLAVLRVRRGKGAVVPWLLGAYALFFTAQMCLSARKEVRYLLPAFPALNVMAAFGVGWIVDRVDNVGERRGQPWIPSMVLCVVILLQALLVLPSHPYYGTLHNRLLGGSRVAEHILPLQDQGEGLDLAARFLNEQPQAQLATAWVYRRSDEVFRRNFLGLTRIADDAETDYRVYSVNQLMRGLGDEGWEEKWQRDRHDDALWTVAFDGVTYVWVYGTPPEKPAAGGPEYEVGRTLGEHIRLERVRISAENLTPGETLTVVPMWTSDGDVKESYKVFCHLVSDSGELVAQRDAFPLDGARETPSWRHDELIQDSYEIRLNRHVPTGEYELSLGMYDPESMKRLPVYDSTGQRAPGDRVVVSTLQVSAPMDQSGEMRDIASR